MTPKRRFEKASSRITKRNRFRKNLTTFLKIIFPAVMLVGLIFLLRADFLQIKNFNVIGAEAVPAEDIKNAAQKFITGEKLLVLPRSDILLINREKLATALLSQFSRLETVDVNKEFFRKNIKLTIRERKADFLWCLPAQADSEMDECFFMDKNGLVFEKSLSAGSAQDKIIFRGVLTDDPIMKNFVPPEQMQNFLSMVEVLRNGGIKVVAIRVEDENKLIVQSDTGDILFNPGEDNLSAAAENVTLLVKEIKSKNPSTRFNYIDARFGSKLYYKLLTP